MGEIKGLGVSLPIRKVLEVGNDEVEVAIKRDK